MDRLALMMVRSAISVAVTLALVHGVAVAAPQVATSALAQVEARMPSTAGLGPIGGIGPIMQGL